MMRLLRSELLKMRSTRTNLALFLSMTLLVLAIVLVHGLTTLDLQLASRDNQRSLLAVGAVGIIFAALVGIMSVTSEYRHGTIRPTLVFSPRRERVVLAKLLASLLVGTVFGVLAEGLTFALGSGLLAARGASFALGAADAAAPGCARPRRGGRVPRRARRLRGAPPRPGLAACPERASRRRSRP